MTTPARHAEPTSRAPEALERNKRTVLAFYEAGLNEKDAEAALRLIGPRYVQHNPRIADGREGFAAFVAGLRRDFPGLRAEVKRLIAEGDHVVAHVHGVRVPGQAGTAIVDIFRLDEDGRIVEHWDVMQPIPGESANRNGMF
ncbi:nuclear transport factor 2 family protein [Streptomyces hoynatensis]|uniref:Polyketide cyclase n=1 Tax=Streptomyces hoynatensis TaxID=1141874 RepID=A0A3A9YNW6_9ACTN|nr:nuclear transport factor 2 family protein [Streptomyces hoynatensis]RKN37094.1 polyketide cyclase [Streptomyces hoynatensis]